jgi:hypothetical protein
MTGLELNATTSGNPQGDRTKIHHIWYVAIEFRLIEPGQRSALGGLCCLN